MNKQVFVVLQHTIWSDMVQVYNSSDDIELILI
jgi:hypothetical protein